MHQSKAEEGSDMVREGKQGQLVLTYSPRHSCLMIQTQLGLQIRLWQVAWRAALRTPGSWLALKAHLLESLCKIMA